MGDGGYKIRDNEAIHFITFAVVDWVDVFTRKEYRDILIESIRYCQQKKGLMLHCWCIMSNHLHLVISTKGNNPSHLLRDFKKFTSKQIIKAIIEHPSESRKEWMLNIFKKAGEANSRNTSYQLWRHGNHPEVLITKHFTNQKLAYIHNNPVKAGIVEKGEEYVYSSAKDYYYGKQAGLLKIEFI